jgi:hypothetical protein
MPALVFVLIAVLIRYFNREGEDKTEAQRASERAAFWDAADANTKQAILDATKAE